MYIPRRSVLQNSVFDIFRSGNTGNQQPPANPNNPPQDNPGNMRPNPNQNPNGNVNDPNNQNNNNNNNNQNPNNQQNNQDPNKSPLDEWKGLWETTPAKEGETPATDWNDHNSVVPAMNIDPKKLAESAKRIDFSKVMNPERVQAALKGDQAAFNEVINSVTQAAFTNMAMSTTKIVEAATRQMAEKLYSGALPHHFRKHAVNNQIDNDLPILSDPAVAPIFEGFKAQMQAKYPKASAKEISDMAKRMMTNFADAVKGGPKKDQPQGGKGGLNKTGVGQEDWGDFFGLESGQQQ